MDVVIEFTVEPFVDGNPGPHVEAAVAEAQEAGLPVEFGPFGTTVTGNIDQALPAARRIIKAALEAGAVRVDMQITRGDQYGPY